jgi:hypothetical protein
MRVLVAFALVELLGDADQVFVGDALRRGIRISGSLARRNQGRPAGVGGGGGSWWIRV